ncbi:uncharacterized protein LOC124292339 [Haliotis rubra]|uniref:uncharacterized protein LOC124292339 n=1 Tax=Haliotis rubra TaxID=36100 RepID=UPI001EE54018|nr:uncharacterized protein LOC124292339 [Haliotis rubra]
MQLSGVQEQYEMSTFSVDKEGVESEYGLDKDGKISGVEGHTAVRQGNTVVIVELTEDTQDDEGSTDTGQDTFALSRQKTGHIQFVIGCILLATIPLIIRAMHINSCPGDARLGHYMVAQGLASMTISIVFAIRFWCRCVRRPTWLCLLANTGLCIYEDLEMLRTWMAENPNITDEFFQSEDSHASQASHVSDAEMLFGTLTTSISKSPRCDNVNSHESVRLTRESSIMGRRGTVSVYNAGNIKLGNLRPPLDEPMTTILDDRVARIEA